MGRNNYFRFKQFTILQEKSAMKVGTDGVLIGAWTDVSGARRILDIGTGTGLIALMMAQRSNASVTGIEIEENAAAEALRNVQNSPWKSRITILNSSFQNFLKSAVPPFDLIVSNPPFFSNSQHSRCKSLAMAKHNHLLPLPALASGSAELLTPDGVLSVILPASSADEFLLLTRREGLKLFRQTIVRPDDQKKPHRCLLEFSKSDRELSSAHLSIHLDDHSGYTEPYKTLTREFYLNF